MTRVMFCNSCFGRFRVLQVLKWGLAAEWKVNLFVVFIPNCLSRWILFCQFAAVFRYFGGRQNTFLPRWKFRGSRERLATTSRAVGNNKNNGGEARKLNNRFSVFTPNLLPSPESTSENIWVTNKSEMVCNNQSVLKGYLSQNCWRCVLQHLQHCDNTTCITRGDWLSTIVPSWRLP